MRFKAALDQGEPLRGFDVHVEEEKYVKGFGLLTRKPMLVILNAGEGDAADLAGALAKAKLDAWKGKPHVAFSAVSAPIEQEIAAMAPEDQAEFLKGLGLPDRALDRLLRAAYDLLGLMSFLTAGEDECRAWSIPKGTHAAKAAAAIHTDFEKHFIRAEVVPFETLVEAGGSLAQLQDARHPARRGPRLRRAGRRRRQLPGQRVGLRLSPPAAPSGRSRAASASCRT